MNRIIIIASTLVVIIIAVIIIGLNMPKEIETIEGQAETTDYRMSSKVPSRVRELRVKEGDQVKRGDTLAVMQAPDLMAKLDQAHAAYSAASAMEKKAANGTRRQQIQEAYESWQKATAGMVIAEKTYKRVERLYENGVMAEQKRDEAKAQYDAMIATEKAAKAQYEMAMEGARAEDKLASVAQRQRAESAVAEVSSYVDETYIIATDDGEVTEIYPEVGELVGTGAPIMDVSILKDVWFTFNIREDLLPDITIGKEMKVYVPATDQTIPVKITMMKNVGNFAVWKATKSLGQYDLKTFEVQAHPLTVTANIHPGMSVILKK